MEELINPSEIAQLVLGYLKISNCPNSWQTFLEESEYLEESYCLYYRTNINGESLLDILKAYYALKSFFNQLICHNSLGSFIEDIVCLQEHCASKRHPFYSTLINGKDIVGILNHWALEISNKKSSNSSQVESVPHHASTSVLNVPNGSGRNCFNSNFSVSLLPEKYANQNRNTENNFNANHQNTVQKIIQTEDQTSNSHRTQALKITKSETVYSRNFDSVPLPASSIHVHNDSIATSSTQLFNAQPAIERQNSKLKNIGDSAKDHPPEIPSTDNRLQILSFTTEKNKQSQISGDASPQRLVPVQENWNRSPPPKNLVLPETPLKLDEDGNMTLEGVKTSVEYSAILNLLSVDGFESNFPSESRVTEVNADNNTNNKGDYQNVAEVHNIEASQNTLNAKEPDNLTNATNETMDQSGKISTSPDQISINNNSQSMFINDENNSFGDKFPLDFSKSKSPKYISPAVSQIEQAVDESHFVEEDVVQNFIKPPSIETSHHFLNTIESDNPIKATDETVNLPVKVSLSSEVVEKSDSHSIISNNENDSFIHNSPSSIQNLGKSKNIDSEMKKSSDMHNETVSNSISANSSSLNSLADHFSKRHMNKNFQSDSQPNVFEDGMHTINSVCSDRENNVLSNDLINIKTSREINTNETIKDSQLISQPSGSEFKINNNESFDNSKKTDIQSDDSANPIVSSTIRPLNQPVIALVSNQPGDVLSFPNLPSIIVPNFTSYNLQNNIRYQFSINTPITWNGSAPSGMCSLVPPVSPTNAASQEIAPTPTNAVLNKKHSDNICSQTSDSSEVCSLVPPLPQTNAASQVVAPTPKNAVVNKKHSENVCSETSAPIGVCSLVPPVLPTNAASQVIAPTSINAVVNKKHSGNVTNKSPSHGKTTKKRTGNHTTSSPKLSSKPSVNHYLLPISPLKSKKYPWLTAALAELSRKESIKACSPDKSPSKSIEKESMKKKSKQKNSTKPKKEKEQKIKPSTAPKKSNSRKKPPRLNPSQPSKKYEKTSKKPSDHDLPVLSISESPGNSNNSAKKILLQITDQFDNEHKSPVLKLLMLSKEELLQNNKTAKAPHIRHLNFDAMPTKQNKRDEVQEKNNSQANASEESVIQNKKEKMKSNSAILYKSDSEMNYKTNNAKAGSSKESQMKRTNSKSKTKMKKSEDSLVQNHYKKNTSELNSLRESVKLNQCKMNHPKEITDCSEESSTQKRRSKRIQEAKKKIHHPPCMPIKESSENLQQQPEQLKRWNSNPELPCGANKRKMRPPKKRIKSNSLSYSEFFSKNSSSEPSTLKKRNFMDAPKSSSLNTISLNQILPFQAINDSNEVTDMINFTVSHEETIITDQSGNMNAKAKSYNAYNAANKFKSKTTEKTQSQTVLNLTNGEKLIKSEMYGYQHLQKPRDGKDNKFNKNNSKTSRQIKPLKTEHKYDSFITYSRMKKSDISSAQPSTSVSSNYSSQSTGHVPKRINIEFPANSVNSTKQMYLSQASSGYPEIGTKSSHLDKSFKINSPECTNEESKNHSQSSEEHLIASDYETSLPSKYKFLNIRSTGITEKPSEVEVSATFVENKTGTENNVFNTSQFSFPSTQSSKTWNNHCSSSISQSMQDKEDSNKISRPPKKRIWPFKLPSMYPTMCSSSSSSSSSCLPQQIESSISAVTNLENQNPKHLSSTNDITIEANVKSAVESGALNSAVNYFKTSNTHSEIPSIPVNEKLAQEHMPQIKSLFASKLQRDAISSISYNTKANNIEIHESKSNPRIDIVKNNSENNINKYFSGQETQIVSTNVNQEALEANMDSSFGSRKRKLSASSCELQLILNESITSSRQYISSPLISKSRKNNEALSLLDATSIAPPEKRGIFSTFPNVLNLHKKDFLSSKENPKSASVQSCNLNTIVKDNTEENSSIQKSNFKYESAQDSPVRHVSKVKRILKKSSLSKKIEEDPTIPAGVKIPSRWNSSKIINYSSAIRESVKENNKKKKQSKKQTEVKQKQDMCTSKDATFQSCNKSMLFEDKSGEFYKKRKCCVALKRLPSTITLLRNEELDQNFKKKLITNHKTIDVSQKTSTEAVSKAKVDETSKMSDNQILALNLRSSTHQVDVDHCKNTRGIVESDIREPIKEGSELSIAPREREMLKTKSENCSQSPDKDILAEEVFKINGSPAKPAADSEKMALLMQEIESLGIDEVLKILQAE